MILPLPSGSLWKVSVLSVFFCLSDKLVRIFIGAVRADNYVITRLSRCNA